MRAADVRQRLAEENRVLHQHKRWLRMWNIIGNAYALQHNLMVLVEQDDREKRRAAAHSVANAIIGPVVHVGIL